MSGIIPGFGTYLRRLWQRKPEQYDFDWAQYSVARNAERIGIDPASIVGYWPFWEGCGHPRNIITGQVGELKNGARWAKQGGLITDENKACFDTKIFPEDYPIGTIWFDFQAFVKGGPTYSYYVYSTNYTDFAFYQDIDDVEYEIEFGNITNSGIPYDINLQDGNYHTASVYWDTPNETCGLYVDSFFQDSRDTLSLTLTENLHFGRTDSDDRYFGGPMYSAIMFDYPLSENVIGLLDEVPYYLLQPVPRTIYFDYGASDSGATTETATLLSVVASTIHEPLVVQESGVLSQVPTSTLVTLDYVLGTWNRILRPDNSWSRRAFTPKTWSGRAFTPKTWSRN
jgi:hypothetical protein